MPPPSLSLKYPGESHLSILHQSGGFPRTNVATAVRTLAQIQPAPMAKSVTAARGTGFYQDSSPHREHNSGRGSVLPENLTTGEVRSKQALQYIFGGVKHKVKHISRQCLNSDLR